MRRAKEILKKYGENARICVAVSGGVDSTCLLRLACEVLPKGNVLAVNVEHGIRGDSSVRDSEFTARTCEELGVELIFRAVDIPALARRSGRSVETEARLFRRELFAEIVRGGKADYVATAHHADDKVESVLMHLFRGSGTKGLIGFTERDGFLIRPFVHERKSEIEEYAKARGIEYVTDETNADVGYLRNYVRREIVPRIEERYSLATAIETVSRCAAADEELIRSLMKSEYIEASGGEAKIKLEAFDCGEALAYRYVTYAAAKIGRFTDLSYERIAAVSSLRGAENGKRVELGGGLIAAREYDSIALYYDEPIEEDELEEFRGVTYYAGGCLSVLDADDEPERGRLILDADSLPSGWVIRLRRSGDRFRPFGSGEKSLREFFIDRKIPLRKRDKIPLLCYNDRVLAVFGVEISDDVRVTSETKNKIELIFTEET